MKRGEFAGNYFNEYENSEVLIDFVEEHESEAFPNAEPMTCEICGLSDGKVVYMDEYFYFFVKNYRPGLDLWFSGEEWYYKDGDKLILLEYGDECELAA